MTSRVVSAFSASKPGEPGGSRRFETGEVLQHVDYASGAVSLFSPRGSPELYEMPMHEFQQFTERISFDEEAPGPLPPAQS